MNRFRSEFPLNAELCRNLVHPFESLLPGFRRSGGWYWWFPGRIGQSWSPPILVRHSFFPQQPDFARALGEQVFLRESLCYSKALSALGGQHHVPGALHDAFGQQRHIFDIFHPRDRTGATSWPVHAAGIEFHVTFFVGETAQTDAIVVGIVFLDPA